ncbi:hypothetical protein [Psychroflexus sp. MBR-150]|jgi:hypothetical protein
MLLFKSIRKSSIFSTAIASILCNVMVFGQPIQQMSQNTSLHKILKSKLNYLSPSSSNGSTYVEPSNPTESNIFYADEQFGLIGVFDDHKSEKIKDNFFYGSHTK